MDDSPLSSVFCAQYAAISLGKIICMAAYILHFGYISSLKFCLICISVVSYLILLHMPLFLRLLLLVSNIFFSSKCCFSWHILKCLLGRTKKNVCGLVLLMSWSQKSPKIISLAVIHLSFHLFVASTIIGNNLKTFYVNEIRKEETSLLLQMFVSH